MIAPEDMLTKVTLQVFDELIRHEQQSWRNEQNPATASRSLICSLQVNTLGSRYRNSNNEYDSLSEQTTVTRYRYSDNEYVTITNREEGVSITELVPITRPECI